MCLNRKPAILRFELAKEPSPCSDDSVLESYRQILPQAARRKSKVVFGARTRYDLEFLRHFTGAEDIALLGDLGGGSSSAGAPSGGDNPEVVISCSEEARSKLGRGGSNQILAELFPSAGFFFSALAKAVLGAGFRARFGNDPAGAAAVVHIPGREPGVPLGGIGRGVPLLVPSIGFMRDNGLSTGRKKSYLL